MPEAGPLIYFKLGTEKVLRKRANKNFALDYRLLFYNIREQHVNNHKNCA